jgi:superfamily II DNA or RNA helicase
MINETQSAIQESALGSWERAGRKGSIAGATGMGKSKIAVDAIIRVLTEEVNGIVYLIVPTEKLRDENWPAELKRWVPEYEDLLTERLRIICYASAHKISGERVLLVVFDEIHHLTQLSYGFMQVNYVRHTLGLSATLPNAKDSPFKHELIKDTAPLCFVYTLDQGVEDGVVSDFEVLIIMEPMDNISKVIDGGSKAKPFKTTEAAQYKYLDGVVRKALVMPDNGRKKDIVKFAMLRRSRFIYNLPSKTRLAKDLKDMVPQNLRMLFFCGSIEQSREIFGENVYNSKDKHLNMLTKFKEDLSIKQIGVVNAVDEGHNIPEVDWAVIVQASSVERQMVQRIGRIVRYREGHKALAIVLCSQGTQDESWINKSFAGMAEHRITRVASREIYKPGFFDKWR